MPLHRPGRSPPTRAIARPSATPPRPSFPNRVGPWDAPEPSPEPGATEDASNVPPGDVPYLEHHSPEHHSLERDSPEHYSLERGSPERGSPQSHSPQRHLPQSHSPKSRSLRCAIARDPIAAPRSKDTTPAWVNVAAAGAVPLGLAPKLPGGDPPTDPNRLGVLPNCPIDDLRLPPWNPVLGAWVPQRPGL